MLLLRALIKFARRTLTYTLRNKQESELRLITAKAGHFGRRERGNLSDFHGFVRVERARKGEITFVARQ